MVQFEKAEDANAACRQVQTVPPGAGGPLWTIGRDPRVVDSGKHPGERCLPRAENFGNASSSHSTSVTGVLYGLANLLLGCPPPDKAQINGRNLTKWFRAPLRGLVPRKQYTPPVGLPHSLLPLGIVGFGVLPPSRIHRLTASSTFLCIQQHRLQNCRSRSTVHESRSPHASDFFVLPVTAWFISCLVAHFVPHHAFNE